MILRHKTPRQRLNPQRPQTGWGVRQETTETQERGKSGGSSSPGASAPPAGRRRRGHADTREQAAPSGQQLSPDAARRLLDADLQPSGLRERRFLLLEPAGLWQTNTTAIQIPAPGPATPNASPATHRRLQTEEGFCCFQNILHARVKVVPPLTFHTFRGRFRAT